MGEGIEPDGAADGLAAVFRLHRAALLRFLVIRCGAADEAEDVLQEMWIKSAAQPSGPIGNARAYLFRMANNLVLDRHRAHQRAMVRDRQWVADGEAFESLPEDRPDPAPRADEEIARRQETEMLQMAIAALRPGAQRALRLAKLEGHSQDEVAEIMGISRSGVEKHLALAMKHLKITLTDCGIYPPTTSERQARAGGDRPEPEARQ